MAEVNNRSMRLSAEDLAQLTDWPVPVIEEFLSMLDNVGQVITSNNVITNTTEVTEQIVSGGQAQTAFLQSRITKAFDLITDNEALASDALTLAMMAWKRDRLTIAQVATRVMVGI